MPEAVTEKVAVCLAVTGLGDWRAGNRGATAIAAVLDRKRQLSWGCDRGAPRRLPPRWVQAAVNVNGIQLEEAMPRQC